MLKKYFLTGLVILLPLALTLAIVIFIINFLTDPFIGFFQKILDYFDLLEINVFFLNSYEVQVIISKIIILVLLFYFTVLLGALARWFFFHFLLGLWDKVLHRIPIVRSIYKASQDIINTMFASKTKSFKQVVLAPFPKEDTYSIGLVTNEDLPQLSPGDTNKRIAVFVPTTPNPTSGFLMLFAENDLIHLNLSVEDAFKYIISCGVVGTPFVTVSKEEAHRLAEEHEKHDENENSPS